MSTKPTDNFVPMTITPQGMENMRKLFVESIERYQTDISKAEALIEEIDLDGGLSDALHPYQELACDALSLLIDNREAKIADLQAGVADIDKSVAFKSTD